MRTIDKKEIDYLHIITLQWSIWRIWPNKGYYMFSRETGYNEKILQPHILYRQTIDTTSPGQTSSQGKKNPVHRLTEDMTNPRHNKR